MNYTNSTSSINITDGNSVIMFIFVFLILIVVGIYLICNCLIICCKLIILCIDEDNIEMIKKIQIILFKSLDEKIMTFKEIIINNN